MTITVAEQGFSILHISDLHFGAHDPEKAAALLSFCGSYRPDMICITGDIADAPKRRLFLQAKDYIQRLALFCDGRVFCIPGNHDALLRGVSLRQFCSALGLELDYGVHTRQRDRDVCIFGVDTTSFSISHFNNSGRFSERSRDALLRNAENLKIKLGAHGFDRAIKVVLVHHHPLPTVKSTLEQMLYFRQSGEFLALVAQHKVDLVLHGHQHDPHHYKIANSNELLVLSAGTATRRVDEQNEGRELCKATQFYYIRIIDHAFEIEEYRYHYPTREFVNSGLITSKRTARQIALRKDYVRYRMCRNGDMSVFEKRIIAAAPNRPIIKHPIVIGVDKETPGCDDFSSLDFKAFRDNEELPGETYALTVDTAREKRIALNLEALPITSAPVELSWSYRWPGGFQRLLENGTDKGMFSLPHDLDEITIDVETEFHRISDFQVIYKDRSEIELLAEEPQRFCFRVTKPAPSDILWFRASVTVA